MREAARGRDISKAMMNRCTFERLTYVAICGNVGGQHSAVDGMGCFESDAASVGAARCLLP